MKTAFAAAMICATACAASHGAAASGERAALRPMVERHAQANGIPAGVAHALVTIESQYRPRIVHRGNYGLMQIRYETARSLGYRGTREGLLNAETNLNLGMKYFSRGWRLSGGELCRAIAFYQTGRPVKSVPSASRVYCARARALMAAR